MATLRRHAFFRFGRGSALPRTTIFVHLNVRSIEGFKWSTIQVQKSTIYLQFALQLNRRLRGRDAHFWSTIYLQSTPADHSGVRNPQRDFSFQMLPTSRSPWIAIKDFCSRATLRDD